MTPLPRLLLATACCSLYNNIIPPSRLSPGSDLHLFREGIEPKWEDPKCEHGGSWKVMVPKGNKALLDTMWLHAVRGRSVGQPPVAGPGAAGLGGEGAWRTGTCWAGREG